MQTVKILGLIVVLAMVLTFCGCGPECKDLRIQNDLQQQRVSELGSKMQAKILEVDQLKRSLDTAQSRCDIETEALSQQITALEEDANKKKALMASMQQQLFFGGTQLPVELSTMLEDFAKTEGEMVTYDLNRGVVKFKSDLLFALGSDIVSSKAKNAVKSLCKILNSEQARKFDIIIAGHTDDMRISRPATRQKHPTNWHLSSHRAIAVLNIMAKSGIISQRLSVRGFGEFRPIEPNKPGKKGNSKNRRVEIYIVAKGL